MKFFLLVATVTLSLLSAAVRAEEEVAAAASNVVTLTVDTFEEQTQALSGQGGDWLVEFYAPWCGHCKRLQPVWEELATELKGKVHVGKVDVTENRALGSRFDIKGFPTIKFFHGGAIYPYKGARSKDAFVAYVNGGYAELTGDKTPEQPSAAESMLKSVVDPFKKAMKDVQKGKYLTNNTIVIALPAFAVFLILAVMCVLPDGSLEDKKKE